MNIRLLGRLGLLTLSAAMALGIVAPVLAAPAMPVVNGTVDRLVPANLLPKEAGQLGVSRVAVVDGVTVLFPSSTTMGGQLTVGEKVGVSGQVKAVMPGEIMVKKGSPQLTIQGKYVSLVGRIDRIEAAPPIVKISHPEINQMLVINGVYVPVTAVKGMNSLKVGTHVKVRGVIDVIMADKMV